MSLRLPAGVYIDGIGYGGRFVDPDVLPMLARATDLDGAVAVLTLAVEQQDRADRAYRRVSDKFQDDPKRYAVKRAEVEVISRFWDDLVREIDAEIAAKVSDVELPPEVEGDDFAVEWEMGLDYNATSGGPNGKSRDFDLNIRIKRSDGTPMGFAEANDVMRSILVSGTVPTGYKAAGIRWRRPGKASRGWKTGDVSDLAEFSAPMAFHANDPTVKMDPARDASWADARAWDFGQTYRLGSVRK